MCEVYEGTRAPKLNAKIFESGLQSYGAPSRKQWEKLKPIITALYAQNTLVDVMREMETSYGFKATQRMYKSRLSSWGSNKSSRSSSTESVASSCFSSAFSSASTLVEPQHTDKHSFHDAVCDKLYQRQHENTLCEELYRRREVFYCGGPLQSSPWAWGCHQQFAGVDGLATHFASIVGRACMKPLVNEEINTLKQISPLVEKEFNDLEYAPAITKHLQPGYQALVAEQERIYCETGMYLPAALLARHPALQSRDWSDVQGVNDPISRMDWEYSDASYIPYGVLGLLDTAKVATRDQVLDPVSSDILYHLKGGYESVPNEWDGDSGYATAQSAGSSLSSSRNHLLENGDRLPDWPTITIDGRCCSESEQKPLDIKLEAVVQFEPQQESSQHDGPQPTQANIIVKSPRALPDPSLPRQAEGDQGIVSPQESTNYTSASPSEQSFRGARGPSSPDYFFPREIGRSDQVFIEGLSNRILDACLNHHGSSSIRQRATISDGSSKSSSQASSGSSPPTSYTTIPSKRSLQEDREGEDHEGDKRQDESGCSAEEGTNDLSAVTLFACPYSKAFPHRYSKQNLSETRYRNCATSYHRDISRLKQHLYRVHALPKHYCTRCFQSFKKRELFTAHARSDPQCEVRKETLYQERMTEDQYERVHRRVIKGDPYQLWYNIFDILFPHGATRPISPYVSSADPVTVAHFVTLFRAVGPETMLEFMRDRREQAEGNLEIEMPTQMIIDEAFELAIPRYVEAQRRVNAQGAATGDEREVEEHGRRQRRPIADSPPTSVLLADQLQRNIAASVEQDSDVVATSNTTGEQSLLQDGIRLGETPYQPPDLSFTPTTHQTGDNMDRNHGHYWSNAFAFDPSEVNDGFDKYAMADNPPLPTIWESLLDENTSFGDQFGYDLPPWPHH